ncbi:MAG: DUF6491 family protein [Sandaracinobacteroides sp.]
MPRYLLPAALLALASCAGSDQDAVSRNLWAAEGPAVNCISLNQVRSFRVIDDRTVLFERNRTQGWRNELPFRCSGLTFGTKFRHNSRTSQLCSLNTITPTRTGSGPGNPACQLGQFQPVTRVTTPPPSPPAG